MSVNRERRRAQEHGRARPPRRFVYDSFMVERDPHGNGLVVLGVGDEGEPPEVVLLLCPVQGVDELVRQLRQVAEPLARTHGPLSERGDP